VATRICPSCGAEAPLSAHRCKQCFHDFATRRMSWGPVLILGVLAVMSFVAALAFVVASMGPVDERVLVSAETKSIVIATKYPSGIDSRRIPFSDVVKLEHTPVAEGFQIVALTSDGDRTVIQSGKEQLYGEAERYSTMMGKTYERIGEVEVPPEESSGS
jgi:hypothetical protein